MSKPTPRPPPHQNNNNRAVIVLWIFSIFEILYFGILGIAMGKFGTKSETEDSDSGNGNNEGWVWGLLRANGALKFTLHVVRAFRTPGLKLILKVGEGGGPSDPGSQGVSGGKVEKHKKKKKKKDHKKKHDRKDREHKKHKKHKRKPLGEEVLLTLIE